MSDCCLHLLCPLAVEERVVDLLLALGESGVFTSAPTHAHGFAHGRLNAAEQVSGRSRASLIHLVLPGREIDGLLAELRRELPHSGVRYWVTEVLSQGELA
jgi:hypothetical protein